MSPTSMTDVLFNRMRFGMAAELASAGAYLRAESWIVGAPGAPLSPEQLDLLARVYVLQERYAEAEACWQKAVTANPHETRYRQALTVLNEHRERLRLRNWILKGLCAFMALMGVLAVTILLVFGKPA